MTISVAKESGDLHSPLKVIAETAPPTPVVVGVLGLLATLAVTVADALGGRRTRSGIWVGLQGALAYTLLDGVYPHSGAMSVIGAGMFAALLGVPLSLLIRWTLFATPLGASKEPPQDTAKHAV
ncbi:MAG: hypothetical protein GXP62_11985 [Oligoflexia bacterium]|nr:hypothetical protein [Oligoflexia bacterium]